MSAPLIFVSAGGSTEYAALSVMVGGLCFLVRSCKKFSFTDKAEMHVI
jgi:hypothetical protein